MRHARRMRGIVAARQTTRRRRGLPGQRRRRRCERGARLYAVRYTRWLSLRGGTVSDAARRLGVSARTLRRWRSIWTRKRLPVRARGRPVKRLSPWRHAEVMSVLQYLGGSIGVPSLRRLFLGAGKRELAELVCRYRHAMRRDRRIRIRALRWTRPGSVWAMDFSNPPMPVDGLYDQIFCVRDLASTKQLWALPTIGKSARMVVQSLDALVRWYGAPLILKVDNDGVFRSTEVRAWARRHGVKLLYSPPYTPQYNGSVECGMATLKVGAHIASAVHDRPGEWTCDDIQEARLRMNREGRPRGAAGPTPDELWDTKTDLSDEQRNEFEAAYQQRYEDTCQVREVDPTVQWRHEERAALDRAALADTVIALGYLQVRRRRITLPVSHRKTARIT